MLDNNSDAPNMQSKEDTRLYDMVNEQLAALNETNGNNYHDLDWLASQLGMQFAARLGVLLKHGFGDVYSDIVERPDPTPLFDKMMQLLKVPYDTRQAMHTINDALVENTKKQNGQLNLWQETVCPADTSTTPLLTAKDWDPKYESDDSFLARLLEQELAKTQNER